LRKLKWGMNIGRIYTANSQKPPVSVKTPAFCGEYTNSTFIYTNDTHGALGMLPNLITGVNQKQKELKGKSPITLSSGNEIMYSNFLNPNLQLQRKKLLVEFLDSMNLDAMTIGNHETGSGLTALAELMKKAKFKLVSTNTKIESTPLEQTEKSGKLVKSYTFKSKDGQTYGMLGVSPLDEFSSEFYANAGDFIGGVKIDYNGTKEEIQAGINKRYENTLEELKKEIKKFEDKGINKIVLLSHLGYEKDTQIIKDSRINGVDVIIGGHSHDKLDGFVYENNDENKKPNVFRTPEGRPIVVTQAGSNANNFGILDVYFDRKGVIATDRLGNIKGSNKLFNSQDFAITPKIDKHINSIIKHAFEDTAKIGVVKNSINPITTRDRENTLITATLDGFINLANKKGTKDLKNLDFAMMNSSTIRGNLPQGALNEGLLSLAFVFAVPMAKVMASEKQIVDTIKHVLVMGGAKGAFDIPQFSSNVKYEMIESKNKDGKKEMKLSKLSINDKEVDLENPSEEKIYKAAVREIYTDTNYFGEAFNQAGVKEAKKCTDNNGKLLDYVEGLAEYLRKNNVNPKTKELTFNTVPKNIIVVETSGTDSQDKKFSIVG